MYRSAKWLLTLVLFSAPAYADDLLQQGTTLYSQICSRCHGFNMVSAGTASFDLRKFPKDQKSRFLNSVSNGKNSMPAMGDLLTKEEIQALWRYVSTRGGKEPTVEETGALEGKKKVVALNLKPAGPTN